MTRHSWDWKLTRGLWTTLLPGVVVAHNGCVSDRQRAWAAVLYAGRGARLSGPAALAVHGLRQGETRVPTSLDVAIPTPRRVRSSHGPPLPVSAHRVSLRPTWDQPVGGLPTLSPQVCVLHASAWARTDRAAEWRLAAVVQQGVSTVPLIRATLEQMPRLPRRALVRAVLDDVELGAHAASELQFLRFCRSQGLPLPDELNLRVRAGGTRFVDAHYRRQRTSIEVDGAHHRLAAQWEADALRSLELAVARRGTGDQVYRITPAAMRHDASRLAALLRALLCP